MKRLTNTINEAVIKVDGAKITNQVNDYSKYNTINELCDSVETHYINNYKDSDKISKKLFELHLIEEDQKEIPGVLYKGGRLLYFFHFHKMEYLCAFLVSHAYSSPFVVIVQMLARSTASPNSCSENPALAAYLFAFSVPFSYM